ncbi:tRNA (adenosine(37)-N6)-dimethylallyltransferase MiaA [Salinithrix halophila]|uniref:tRNA dimethylallyltransferase n=1 Tax=Salinithrix halophila TaxID=1485204 RepID=A0ABV8JGU5_9BACL
MPSVSSTAGGDLLLIVGPTAVGKTSLSLKLAEEFRGEILSGDSMQVYRYLDIGTAKASPEELARVPHHLIDLLEPDESFSVDQFQCLARRTIREVQERGHLPMIVGGTGLYIQAITHGYQMPDVKADATFRREMEAFADREGNASLHAKLVDRDAKAAARLHPNDRRRIIRALEIIRGTGKTLDEVQRRKPSPYRTCWIGLTRPREQLYDRINRRVDQMMKHGLLQEVAALKRMGYTRTLVSMQALGYKELMLHLEGELSLDEAVSLIKQRTRKFAKRQLSWFRRLPEIHWFDVTREGAYREIRERIAGNFPQSKE